jgi:hypothetical protein
MVIYKKKKNKKKNPYPSSLIRTSFQFFIYSLARFYLKEMQRTSLLV